MPSYMSPLLNAVLAEEWSSAPCELVYRPIYTCRIIYLQQAIYMLAAHNLNGTASTTTTSIYIYVSYIGDPPPFWSLGGMFHCPIAPAAISSAPTPPAAPPSPRQCAAVSPPLGLMWCWCHRRRRRLAKNDSLLFSLMDEVYKLIHRENYIQLMWRYKICILG